MGYGLWAVGGRITKPVEQAAEGVLVRIKVQPRASRTEVVGLHGDMVRVRLTAPPVDGQANDELIRFLSQQLDVPRSAIRLVSGASSRSKTIMISGAQVGDVKARLDL